jgi:hypothetical protein
MVTQRGPTQDKVMGAILIRYEDMLCVLNRHLMNYVEGRVQDEEASRSTRCLAIQSGDKRVDKDRRLVECSAVGTCVNIKTSASGRSSYSWLWVVK